MLSEAAGLTGFALLSLYCILHEMSTVGYLIRFGKRRKCTIVTMVWYTLLSIISMIGVLLWLSFGKNVWEWVSVISFGAYFLPFVIEFCHLRRPVNEDYVSL
jgi:hypothetical protein